MNAAKRQNYRSVEAAMMWRAEAEDGTVRTGTVVAQREGLAEWIAQEIAEAWAACGAFEWIALAYLAASSVLIALFAENLSHPAMWIGVQALVACVILILCGMEARVAKRAKEGCAGKRRVDRNQWAAIEDAEKRTDKSVLPTAGFWHFWRHWYPHLFFLFCFEELGRLVHLIKPGWQDSKLIAADYWLIGAHPAVWLEQFATPARNDFMQFAYLTYFTYLLILGGVLYYRKDWRAYWSVMTYSAAGYAIGYVIAILFPIESPWFAMAGTWHGPLEGGPFTATINFIEHFGRVRGAAFPSEHVAGSIAALWGAWRHRRWLFWVMAPLVLCMCVSTVWGRYHYVVDVFGGMVTGTVGYVVGERVMKWRGAVKETGKDVGATKAGEGAEDERVRTPKRCGGEALHR